ncbi:HD domain-containing phosphohydrolase [Desulfosediminicola flagellatus]|uniref:HD domain-containing phosphohydrolase n=1 Tax=Desulfosediminicola flagellatus TaxID=2569541 RepID=UPI0010AD910A|nr:HD domain-containing phosphohydrolase [Desulfosediminicola flagellatus]
MEKGKDGNQDIETSKELKRIISLQQDGLSACDEELRRLKSLLNSTHDMVQEVLVNGRVAFVNTTWITNLEIGADEISQIGLMDAVHPHHQDTYRMVFERALSEKQPQDIYSVFVSRSNQEIIVQGTMVPVVVSERVVSVQIFLKDVTQLETARAAERRMSAYKNTLIDATMLISKNLDLHVTLRRTIQAARRLSSARYAAIAVIEDGKVVRFIHEGMSEEIVKQISRCPPQKGLIAAIVHNPDILMLDDISSDHRAAGFPEGHPEMKAYIGAPVMFDDVLYGVIYLTKGEDEPGFTELDCSMINNFAAHAAVAIHNAKLHAQVKASSLETIHRLAKASEFRDKDTGTHIMRMSYYSAMIAKTLGLDSSFVETILYAAAMHDIGKIATPDNVLLKPGKLDGSEWEIMKKHTVFGADILHGADNVILKMAGEIALTHQEKYDGSGYPKGLSGDDIPLSGRIVAVADVFDALTMRRPYKPAFDLVKTFEIMSEGRGTHFDPVVLDAFFKAKKEILQIKAQHSGENSNGKYRFFNVADFLANHDG